VRRTPKVHEPVPVRVAELRPHPRNYRRHPPEQRRHLAESLRANGTYRNVAAARDLTLLAGHGVWETAREEGIEELPTVLLALDPFEPKAIKILAADNELPLTAENDDRQLADLLREVQAADPTALLGTGYDPAALAHLAYSTRRELGDADEAAAWADAQPEAERAAATLVISFHQGPASRERFARRFGVEGQGRDKRAWSAWWAAA